MHAVPPGEKTLAIDNSQFVRRRSSNIYTNGTLVRFEVLQYCRVSYNAIFNITASFYSSHNARLREFNRFCASNRTKFKSRTQF